LAHFHIGRLHLKSCSAADGLLSVAFADAATRLTAEFRRSALALEDYRAKQIARCQGSAGSVPVVEPEPEVRVTGKRVSKAKKKPAAKKQDPENKEMPEWLRKRMSPTMDESLLAASIN
jgi:hypothetical protein